MSKQCLDAHQMQHLQELGLDTSNASMVWCKCDCEKEYSHLLPKDEDVFERCLAVKYIPAYTLQDVLDALPDFINEYCLIIDMSFGVIRYDNLTRKNNPILKEKYFNDEDNELIDAAYSLLCWAIDNKFVETNKNE